MSNWSVADELRLRTLQNSTASALPPMEGDDSQAQASSGQEGDKYQANTNEDIMNVEGSTRGGAVSDSFASRMENVFGGLEDNSQAHSVDKQAILQSLDADTTGNGDGDDGVSRPGHVRNPDSYLKYSCEDTPVHDQASNHQAAADTFAMLRAREDGTALRDQGMLNEDEKIEFVSRRGPNADGEGAAGMDTDDGDAKKTERVRKKLSKVTLSHLDEEEEEEQGGGGGGGYGTGRGDYRYSVDSDDMDRQLDYDEYDDFAPGSKGIRGRGKGKKGNTSGMGKYSSKHIRALEARR